MGSLSLGGLIQAGVGGLSPFGLGVSPSGGVAGLGSLAGLGGLGSLTGLAGLNVAWVTGQVTGTGVGGLNYTPQGTVLVCR